MISPRSLGALLATLGCLWSHAAPADPAAMLRLVTERLCPISPLTAPEALAALPGSALLEAQLWPTGAAPRRSFLRLSTAEGRELHVEQRLRDGRVLLFRAALHDAGDGAGTQGLQATADGTCTLRSGRAIRAGDGPWRHLDLLEADLATLRSTEILQAPWPAGRDPGGVRVAFVDAGLAYDLPLFRDRLARGADGMPLGYDFWDMDPWPYDGDTSRSAFAPIRHGTRVASVFVAEAPGAALIPYRYPRPDMDRLGALVARAAEAGARIIALPLGSTRAEDWTSFAAALAAHDMLAIASAGNDGRDIDARPVYPAALPAPNLITVTSSDDTGRLARGSNWGARHVDLMLPGENRPVTDFRGAPAVASGSSFAVPRLAALAARLLAEDPGMSIAELKTRIFARAIPALPDKLAIGWIPDPLAE